MRIRKRIGTGDAELVATLAFVGFFGFLFAAMLVRGLLFWLGIIDEV